MDRGFYSEDNINALFKEHLKFLIAVRMSLSFVRRELDLIYDTFRSFEYYSEDYELYSRSVQTHWQYTQYHPYKNETTSTCTYITIWTRLLKRRRLLTKS